MLIPRRLALLLASLLCLSCTVGLAQDALQPEPMADPLRALRVQQRDTWQQSYDALREAEDPKSSLTAAWALFHQFDVDYFALLEDEGAALLDEYERTTDTFRKSLSSTAKEDSLALLTMMELDALLDDFNANRLQNARPEGLPGDAPQVKAWNDKFGEFQKARATALQERGKLVLKLYRSGDVDVVRLCMVLLERQIAERVLVEHQEMIAGAKNAERYAARRKSLFAKQRQEWKQLSELLPDTTARPNLVPLGDQICEFHLLTLDLLQSRLASPTTDAARKAADEESAALARKVFTAYRELHRTTVAQSADGKLSVEQLARFHDLRMYTTVWSDAALPPADVIADSIEVAEMWARLHQQLTKDDENSNDARIALAKKLETEITSKERQGTPAPKEEAAAKPAPAK